MLVSDIVLCSKSETSVAKNVVKGVVKRKTTSLKSRNKSKISSKTYEKLVGNEINAEKNNSVDYKVKDYNATDASGIKLNHEDTAIPVRYFIEKSQNNKVIESKNKNHAESRKEIFPNQDKYEDARLKNNLILQSEENYLAYKISREKIIVNQNMKTVNTKSLSPDSGNGNTRNVSQDRETGISRNLSQDSGTGNTGNVSQDTGIKNTINVSQDTETLNTRNLSQDTETVNSINTSQNTGIGDLRNIYQDTGIRNTKNVFQNTGLRNTKNMSQDKETENTKSVSQGAETGDTRILSSDIGTVNTKSLFKDTRNVNTNVIQDSEIVETRRVSQRKGGVNSINIPHITRNMGQETENVNSRIQVLSKERVNAVRQMGSAPQDTELMNQAKGNTHQQTGSMILSKSTKHVVWLTGILICVACFKSAFS